MKPRNSATPSQLDLALVLAEGNPLRGAAWLGRAEPLYRYCGPNEDANAAAARILAAEVRRLRSGIAACLHENGHLADGDDCTLAGLKELIRFDDINNGP